MVTTCTLSCVNCFLHVIRRVFCLFFSFLRVCVVTGSLFETEENLCQLLADAAKVVEKEQQVMEDEEFPAVYTLTVFPFSTDVS